MPKHQRQPIARPSHSAHGTPMMVAIVRPSRMRADASARRSLGTSEAAISMATPK
jgi:hypothetical protein